MASKINALRERLDAVARGEGNLETDEEFAYAAGQVIDRISRASVAGDKSFGYLEPFLAQSNAKRLKEAIAGYFKRYKHENFSRRFETVAAEVMTFELEGNLTDLVPFLLAGVFSANQLYTPKAEAVEVTA